MIASPSPELNHSCTTSEGESADSKESGSDTISPDDQQGPPHPTTTNKGGKEQEKSEEGETNRDREREEKGEGATESSEFAMLNLRLVLPGVQQPLNALVSEYTSSYLPNLMAYRSLCCLTNFGIMQFVNPSLSPLS